ncbi:tRNA lysidine(34) synthetase TilS [Zobellia barbeyronii]|uniref:tRNA(Ile)-lysidine synthase n=2 Tax=Zobellia TaxID=112040 RepID=A0ABS5WIA6_9FLAO|nr:tRNA lysidine(34) synthetase TilS [Zobellia barbeyronii]MBT2163043.1 tRNA lysidine(34) synthetase TilS [Zobellia barbeyronii]
MLEEFQKHIEINFQNLIKDKFLLACSGGLDSTVLVDLCTKSKLDFTVAHCNFNLRGEASNADEDFVQNLAAHNDKNFLVTNFDTIGYVEENKVSIQIGARELRYRWFAEIMRKNHIKILVTAHHVDDSLETFLINLSRGTGIDGLTGIPEKTDTLSRPLLRFSRSQILEYAQSQKLQWREDASNADTKYLRNKIRHEIVPLLKDLNPSFLKNFTKTQDYLSESAALIDSQVKELKSRLFKEDNDVVSISIAELLKLEPISAYIHALFKNYGFTEWNDVENLLSAMSGKEIHSKTHRLLKDREFLLLAEIKDETNVQYQLKEEQTEVLEPIQLKIETVHNLSIKNKHTLYIDKKALKYPLTIRKWKNGDYFYPLGMKGRKKLSKFFKDEKVDVVAKEQQWLLCSGEEVVWVIGRRADERFKVTKNTSEILKFTLN